MEILEGRIQDLEWELMRGWENEPSSNFSRRAIVDIADIARVMAVKNPLIQQAVSLKMAYTFGQGVSISGEGVFGEVIRDWLDDERNQAEITSHQAMMMLDKGLQCDGNLFLVLFTNRVTGRVRVRSIPLVEIIDIIKNPEDSKEPWFYIRQHSTGNTITAYPDLNYNPINRPTTINIAPWGNIPVETAPVLHIKEGGFSDWDYGLSSLFAAQDWAKAYTRFLEDVATYMSTLSMFAAKVTTGGGKPGLAKAKAKFSSTVPQGLEKNPSFAPGSAFIRGQDGGNFSADWEPIKVSGMAISPEDGRRFILMVCAAIGLPETFLGDVSVGSLATAKSLDRPTELLMQNRQKLWQAILSRLLRYVILQSALATKGKLRKHCSIKYVIDEGERIPQVTWSKNPETGEPYSPTFSVVFPPVVELDTLERVTAIGKAATLDGQVAAGKYIDQKTISRLLFEALGEQATETEFIPRMINNLDEILKLLETGAININELQDWLNLGGKDGTEAD